MYTTYLVASRRLIIIVKACVPHITFCFCTISYTLEVEESR